MARNNIISFLWQHILLLIALYIMTLGVAICVRSLLGSSVISTIPYVMESAGESVNMVPEWTIGQYTIIMNCILVALQILILRRDFEIIQLLQLVIGFVFGILLDFNMAVTSWVIPTNDLYKALTQLIGCTILGIGIALEVKCGSVTMPGEGITITIYKVSKIEFSRAKIIVDTTLVIIAIILCFILLGTWQWQIIGVGTLFAMVYVSIIVKITNNHLKWFERLIQYRPGVRRYVYGLAKYINQH